MIDYPILTDDEGGTVRLTTDSPASSYGIPVLAIDADDIRGAFGPGDIVTAAPLMTGADLVARWGSEPERTEAERAAARRYLRQWPEGPQLPA